MPRSRLVDAAFAPLFHRLQFARTLRPILSLQALPRLQEWSRALEAEPAVRNSIVPDFDQRMRAIMRNRSSVLLGTG